MIVVLKCTIRIRLQSEFGHGYQQLMCSSSPINGLQKDNAVKGCIIDPGSKYQNSENSQGETRSARMNIPMMHHNSQMLQKNNHSRKTFASLMPNRVWLAHPGGYVLRLFQCNKLVRLGVQIKQLWISAGTIFFSTLKVAEKKTQIIVALNHDLERHNSAICARKKNKGKGMRASQTTIPNDFFTAQLKVQG